MIYEKMYNLGEEISEYNYKGLFRITKILIIFCSIFICSLYSIKGEWKNIFYYPNEEYEILEKEATRMVEKKDYDKRNRVGYKYVIDNYDSETHILNMRMIYTGNNQSILVTTSTPIIYVQVENGEAIIERKEKSSSEYIAIRIIEIIGLTGIMTYIFVLIILILCLLIRKVEKIV